MEEWMAKFSGTFLIYMVPFASIMVMKCNWSFQQDKYSKHTAKETLNWFQRKKIKLLELPSQSPYLNPTKNVWKELKIRVNRRGWRNIQDLYTLYVKEWAKIIPEQCMQLVSPRRRCLKVVVTSEDFFNEI